MRIKSHAIINFTSPVTGAPASAVLFDLGLNSVGNRIYAVHMDDLNAHRPQGVKGLRLNKLGYHMSQSEGNPQQTLEAIFNQVAE